jgi:putative transposase
MDIKGDKNGFDYEAFRQATIAKMMAGEKELAGKDGLLAPLLKDLLGAALSGEMQAHVEQNRPNRRNGSKAKRVKTGHGPLEVEMPRDRDGTFEPKLIGKRQTSLGEGLDNRILSLYSKGIGAARAVLPGHSGTLGRFIWPGDQHRPVISYHR